MSKYTSTEEQDSQYNKQMLEILLPEVIEKRKAEIGKMKLMKEDHGLEDERTERVKCSQEIGTAKPTYLRRNLNMKHTEVSIIITVLAGAFIFHQHVAAQYNVPYSVIGSGGAALTGGSYDIVGTLGQPAIGRLTGASNIHEVGFWYLPNRITTGVKQEPDKGLPTEYRLEQNYPNPFNPATTIEFSLPQTAFVTLKIFSLLGEEVTTLVNQELNAGTYKVQWNCGALASTTYFYRLQAGDPLSGSGNWFVQTKRLVLLR